MLMINFNTNHGINSSISIMGMNKTNRLKQDKSSWECISTLLRIGGDLSAGSPTDTLLQLSPPHRTQAWHRPKPAPHQSPTRVTWRAVCARSRDVFTAGYLRAITRDSNFTRASFSPRSELRPGFEIGFSFQSCDPLSRPLYVACSPEHSGHTDLPSPAPSSHLTRAVLL